MPRLSESLKKELYIESLRKRLRHLYSYGESHPKERSLIAARLDGFIEASAVLQICSKSELQSLIDEEHFAAFGMSLVQRSEVREKELSDDEPNWSGYDTPAFERGTMRRGQPRKYSSKGRDRKCSPQKISKQRHPKRLS